MEYRSFEDMPVWQKAFKLAVEVYEITVKFPKSELYTLTSDLKRAAFSIPANIAEAFGRFHYLDKVNFYLNARGSAEEVKNHLLMAFALKFIDESKLSHLKCEYQDLVEEINKIVKSFRSANKN